MASPSEASRTAEEKKIVATYVCTRHSSDGLLTSWVFMFSLEGVPTPAIMCPTCHRIYAAGYEHHGPLEFYCDRLLYIKKLEWE
jgi:hypothetical protein